MRLWKSEDGQALVVAALSISLLMGFLALAVDVGVLFRAKRNVQIAADASALAAALANRHNMDYRSAANSALAANGYANGVNGVSVAVTQSSCQQNLSLNCYEARLTVPNPTFFMRMFSFGSVTVAARAIAGPGPVENDYILSGSGANLINNGPIALASDSKLITNASDPLNLIPPPTTGPCNAALTTGSATQGCYNGITISAGATVALSPGLYVINGPINLAASSTLTGSGVTIFFDFNSSNPINIDPAATMNLSAPVNTDTLTTPWNGILFFGISAGTFALNGKSSSSLQGIIYLPNGTLDLGGAGNMQRNLNAGFVVSQLLDTGATNITMNNYFSNVNPTSPLRTTALLE